MIQNRGTSEKNRPNRVRILAEVPEKQAEDGDAVNEKTLTAETTEAWIPNLDWFRQNIPCMIACPANTRIPEYLHSLSQGKYIHSFIINQQDNIFPHTLGRVCARPCESACRHAVEGLGEPVARDLSLWGHQITLFEIIFLYRFNSLIQIRTMPCFNFSAYKTNWVHPGKMVGKNQYQCRIAISPCPLIYV